MTSVTLKVLGLLVVKLDKISSLFLFVRVKVVPYSFHASLAQFVEEFVKCLFFVVLQLSISLLSVRDELLCVTSNSLSNSHNFGCASSYFY